MVFHMVSCRVTWPKMASLRHWTVDRRGSWCPSAWYSHWFCSLYVIRMSSSGPGSRNPGFSFHFRRAECTCDIRGAGGHNQGFVQIERVANLVWWLCQILSRIKHGQRAFSGQSGVMQNLVKFWQVACTWLLLEHTFPRVHTHTHAVLEGNEEKLRVNLSSSSLSSLVLMNVLQIPYCALTPLSLFHMSWCHTSQTRDLCGLKHTHTLNYTAISFLFLTCVEACSTKGTWW